jgi:hypothetical protein
MASASGKVSPGHSKEAFTIEATPELLEYVRSAGPETAVGRARAFGIDVDALVIKLATTTPSERLDALDKRIDDVRALRSALP